MSRKEQLQSLLDGEIPPVPGRITELYKRARALTTPREDVREDKIPTALNAPLTEKGLKIAMDIVVDYIKPILLTTSFVEAAAW